MPPRRSKRKRDNPADAAGEDDNAASANNVNVDVDAAPPVAQVDISGGATGVGSTSAGASRYVTIVIMLQMCDVQQCFAILRMKG